MKNMTKLLTIMVAVLFIVSTTQVLAATASTQTSSQTSSSKKSNKKKKKTSKKSSAKKKASIFKGTVNINRANKEELMQLPGIGEVRANAIIKSRKKKGKFKKADDLLRINGIGKQTLKGLKKHLKF